MQLQLHFSVSENNLRAADQRHDLTSDEAEYKRGLYKLLSQTAVFGQTTGHALLCNCHWTKVAKVDLMLIHFPADFGKNGSRKDRSQAVPRVTVIDCPCDQQRI